MLWGCDRGAFGCKAVLSFHRKFPIVRPCQSCAEPRDCATWRLAVQTGTRSQSADSAGCRFGFCLFFHPPEDPRIGLVAPALGARPPTLSHSRTWEKVPILMRRKLAKESDVVWLCSSRALLSVQSESLSHYSRLEHCDHDSHLACIYTHNYIISKFVCQ